MSDVWSLALTTFLASMVEMVEAMTIVLAMGFTRGWRSTLGGAAAALVVLAVFTYAAGYSLATWLPRSALQLGVGGALLLATGFAAALLLDVKASGAAVPPARPPT